VTLNFPLQPIYDRDLSTLRHFTKGVVVFDRDGTLIKDAGQHNSKELLEFLPGAAESIKFLSHIGYGLAIASNQAGLESEKFTIDDLLDFNNALRLTLREHSDTDIDLIVVCPHLASTNCDCRKPKVGLLEAIERTGLGELKLFVGDSESDRIAAKQFGVEYIQADGNDLVASIKVWVGKKCV
jgi:D-glycero-D-manno-heptose 1,7-bisphosphate phosphatase